MTCKMVYVFVAILWRWQGRRRTLPCHRDRTSNHPMGAQRRRGQLSMARRQALQPDRVEEDTDEHSEGPYGTSWLRQILSF
jgi:hypothetical protein